MEGEREREGGGEGGIERGRGWEGGREGRMEAGREGRGERERERGYILHYILCRNNI